MQSKASLFSLIESLDSSLAEMWKFWSMLQHLVLSATLPMRFVVTLSELHLMIEHLGSSQGHALKSITSLCVRLVTYEWWVLRNKFSSLTVGCVLFFFIDQCSERFAFKLWWISNLQ
jgi:hypothetical protein